MAEPKKQNDKKLTWICGFALFAIFFGAGNLIFPPNLGRISGDTYPLAAFGFLLAEVGLVLMCLFAIAKTNGGLDQWAGYISPTFAKVLLITILLIVGPLVAIPRTAATAFEIGVQPNLPMLPPIVFSLIYFAIAYWFVFDSQTVVDKIGKLLSPVLFITLMALIVMGMLDPVGSIINVGQQNAFNTGFIEGYQTMDALAAALIGILLLNRIRQDTGETLCDASKRRITKVLSYASLIAGFLLSVVYGGLIYLGATSTSVPGDFSHSEILLWLAREIFGPKGTLFLSVMVSFACLTTCIGLLALIGDYFEKLTHNKLSYRTVVLVTLICSLVISTFGVTKIIHFAAPVLLIIYPVTIILIVLTFVTGFRLPRHTWIGYTVGGFLGGILSALQSFATQNATTHPTLSTKLDSLILWLPFSKYGFGWVTLSFLGAGIAIVWHQIKDSHHQHFGGNDKTADSADSHAPGSKKHHASVSLNLKR